MSYPDDLEDEISRYGDLGATSKLREAIDRYVQEQLDAEDAYAHSRLTKDEEATEPPSVVALLKASDEAETHGWTEASRYLRAAAREISNAFFNLDCGSSALAEQNVRPSAIKWAKETVEWLAMSLASEAPTLSVGGDRITVMLNGEQRSVLRENASYETVVEWAGLSGAPTVTWRRAGGMGDVLRPGQVLPLVPGMVINVVYTSDA